MKKYVLVLILNSTYVIPYVPAKIMLSYLYLHLSLLDLFWTIWPQNPTSLVFIFSNNSCDLNRYIIGLYYPCGLQTITDFIQFLILQIVRGRGGFPLALEVNGKSLYKKVLQALFHISKQFMLFELLLHWPILPL